MPNHTLYLASASPRRSALLLQLGISHRIQPVDINEDVLPNESPLGYVSRLSQTKAATLFERLRGDGITLGADTCVALGDEIFGKPVDEADALRMFERLSDRTHHVHTAVTVHAPDGVRSLVSSSEVEFRAITAEEARAYWRSGEPRDKAGGYAVQGRAAVFIRRIAGSYTGIMGLPLFETVELLRAVGFDTASMLSGEAA